MDKGTRINVIDKGYVELIDYMGSDEQAIRAARMSTGKGFQGWEKDESFLEFLYSHNHSSPFEMNELILEVKAPIFVFREWHRHRTQSYNEFSARYAVMPDEHYVPGPTRIQAQNTKNKQGSADPLDPELAQKVVEGIAQEQSWVYDSYNWMLGQGVAKEVSRINTPVSRYSKMWAKANLRNWLHFEDLRLAENAQWEIRQYAGAVAEIIKALWPRTYQLFEEYTRNAVTLSATEAAAVRRVLRQADLAQELDAKRLEKLCAKLGI